jgi:hypothetical protein
VDHPHHAHRLRLAGKVLQRHGNAEQHEKRGAFHHPHQAKAVQRIVEHGAGPEQSEWSIRTRKTIPIHRVRQPVYAAATTIFSSRSF